MKKPILAENRKRKKPYVNKFKILANNVAFPSARTLKTELEKLFPNIKEPWKVFLTSNPGSIRDKNFIRYGNSAPVNVEDTKLNSAEFIRLTSNKNAFSKLLQELGTLTPIFRKDSPNEKDFPVVIRESLFLSGGKGIHIAKNAEEFKKLWRGNYWWTPFIKVEFELRLHILGGEIVKIFKKVREDGLGEEEFPIRNLSNGYHFSLREAEKYKKTKPLIQPIAEKLAELGGSFFTLDIGWSSERKQYAVFEANSASGLNEHTASEYARFIFKSFFPEINLVPEINLNEEKEDNNGIAN